MAITGPVSCWALRLNRIRCWTLASGAPGSGVYGMRSDATMEEHWGAHFTETGADGRYALHGLPAGAHPLAVEAQGYPVAPATVEVVAGSTSTCDVPPSWA